jgi:hypothetical protein
MGQSKLTATSVELKESSRIPVESSRVSINGTLRKWTSKTGGRARRVDETSDISARGLWVASECKTSGDQPEGLRETRGISAGGARNQRIYVRVQG